MSTLTLFSGGSLRFFSSHRLVVLSVVSFFRCRGFCLGVLVSSWLCGFETCMITPLFVDLQERRLM